MLCTPLRLGLLLVLTCSATLLSAAPRMAAALRRARAVSKVWKVAEMAGDVQTYKKHILLYPESGNMAEYDPWLIGAEDWFGGAHRAEGKGFGFEPHPHRGFETITYMITGALRHTDESVGRKGNTAVVTAGDVQWMTAGKGVVHSEMPEGDEEVHLLQIWLNLPSKLKAAPPGHQDLRAKDFPVVAVVDPGGDTTGSVKVIAGEHEGVFGPAKTHFPVQIVEVALNAGASTDVQILALHRGFVVVLEGSGVVGGKEIEENMCGWLSDGEDKSTDAFLRVIASPKGLFRVLVLSGTPHGEPVVSRGPFVMNTAAELSQAFDDYRRGKF